MTTKEQILNAALTLFSEKGYNAVSVRHIAAEVGIKASSLYNHFENKQDILHELVEKNIKYINDFIEKMDIENLFNSDKFTNIESFNSTFIDMSLKIIKFFLENATVVKFRKMLIIEQFSNPELSALYQKIFITDILEYESKLFKCFMDKNILIKTDPYILALQFYSPIFLLLYNEDKINKKLYKC